MDTTNATTKHLRVSDVVRPVGLTLKPGHTMPDAACLMKAHGVHAAPVVDEFERCIGILSARDFVNREATLSGDCEIGSTRSETRTETANDGSYRIVPCGANCVGDYMTVAVQGATTDLPLQRASQIMLEEHVHQLPVFENNRLVGIVSIEDALAGLVETMQSRC